MLCDTMDAITPQKSHPGGVDEICLIEDIEKKLESFSHLLERSSEKEKTQLRRITEQAAAISSLQIENRNLVEENDKLRFVVDTYMKNFVCFVDNLKKTEALEQENLELKQKIDQLQNETADKVVDEELEKDRLQKANAKLTKENDHLNKENESLKQSFKKLNKMVLESFENTMSGGKEEKIKRLNDTIASKDKLIIEVKAEVEKIKEGYEKTIKQKSLEYELLKMDYQSIIVQNIQARQNTLKAERNKNQKNEKSEKWNKSEKSEVSEISTNTKTTTKRPFKIITNQPETTIVTEERSGRRTRGASNKRNTTLKTMNEELENDENLYKGDEDDFQEEEFELEMEDSLLDDEDFEEEEVFIPKKGKRKAKESKKKPAQQTKKIKKNENKDLLLVNRNTIQYHLFN